MDEYTYALRYDALNHPEADPADPNSWTEYLFVADSMLTAVEQCDLWLAIYAGNDNIKNIQVVVTPTPTWQPFYPI
ncbi:hypothetical protein 40AC_10 [Mycobacterium phage 40AC]|uniref:Uncharacterized protein n=1 Tax=Mycobacterium phage 40AC TaxID=1458717 RepID=W8E8X4_9CAUD|nr:hypothetical protein ST40AC_10 [Mycobacterium phage 40AC]AHJ86374.1 hypothetical protein 40AC_10 [Mycobacterium phage 40AC]